MQTKEEIAKKYVQCTCDEIYTSRRLTAPDCPYHTSDVESAMDEWAIAFVKWVFDNNFCPNSSGLWFNYTLPREEVRFYTLKQLYDWFDTGVKYEPPSLDPLLKLIQNRDNANR